MSRSGKGRSEDLFLELANDRSGAGDGARPPSRGGRVSSSRMSFTNNRRSLPAESVPAPPVEGRPKTSGQVFANRAASRLDSAPSELQRHVERYRNAPSRAPYQTDDAISTFSTRSRSGRPQRYAAYPDRSAMSPPAMADNIKSSELSQNGRRRRSFGAPPQSHKTRPRQLSLKQHESSDSPADSSDPKLSLPDSESAESQTEDTVWDELDDLKSRIKRIETTGKMPPSSGAVVSGEQGERPRTATTAPTTIDSSPKRDKPEKKLEPEAVPEEIESLGDKPSEANGTTVHPLLHSALAKAKPLLSASLYRSLEATATDALQLVTMTGNSGPQGAAYSAAAIVNSVNVSDRYVRRKADMMCRNLTDLCLALCEGKHEAPSIVSSSSPVMVGTPINNSLSLRLPRSSLGPNDGLDRSAGRPVSRLEARRTSILGSGPKNSSGTSPRVSSEDISASEQEGTPSHVKALEPKRSPRPASRLQAARLRHYGEASEDEDPTIRPASRAMTDIGRAKPAGAARDFSTPQRSPSLRDSLVARRANAAAYEGNRVASLTSDSGSRRRFQDPSTPPVLEEEADDGGGDFRPISVAKRRVMSFNHAAGRRTATDMPNRAASLSQRRHLM
ncbi:hypothetical protein LTR37_015440 [Vermiconidia calcicola]|uniref:Uncharacterized protein n=1 Tax=Vermiconidia calcicola TaxID=1690605 RepID=A0ACC3MQM7_9PEZI|nr:hypothetical protein LTR37_015440 [Vermiconidia calcicola]